MLESYQHCFSATIFRYKFNTRIFEYVKSSIARVGYIKMESRCEQVSEPRSIEILKSKLQINGIGYREIESKCEQVSESSTEDSNFKMDGIGYLEIEPKCE